MKLFKLTMNIYGKHLISILLTAMMITMFYAMAEKKAILFSLLSGLIYAALCYSAAWRYGSRDARRIQGFYPDRSLPVKASLLAMILPLAMIMLRIFSPDIWAVDLPFMKGETEFFIGGLKIYGTPDFIYRMWQLPLAGFIPSGNIVVYFLVLLIEPIFVCLGYEVGLRRFSIMEYVSAKLVFSQKASDGKNKKKKHEDSFRR